jgi:hypothetical protein
MGSGDREKRRICEHNHNPKNQLGFRSCKSQTEKGINPICGDSKETSRGINHWLSYVQVKSAKVELIRDIHAHLTVYGQKSM